jgi:hypothetical protein
MIGDRGIARLASKMMIPADDWRPRHSPANSTNVLDEGLRIGKIGHRMNSKIKSIKQGMYRK